MVWFLLFLFAGIVGITIVYSYWYGITPTPTSPIVKKKLLSMLPKLFQGDVIAELGSGWGNLAFTLACRFPACKIVGYEISPFPYYFSKIASNRFTLPNLIIERKDFFQIPLHQVSLVVCYLYSGAMYRLKEKFENELAPNTYVISHTFAIPGWIPIRVERADDLYRTPIYLYRTGIDTYGPHALEKETQANVPYGAKQLITK